MREKFNALWHKVCTRCTVVAIGLVGLTVSCIDSDSLFGNSFIPPTMELDTYIDSSMTLRTSLIDLDSISTSLQGAVYLSNYHSDIFGYFGSSGFSTFYPYGFDNDTLFGVSPTVDSMKAFINFNGCIGDTSYIMDVTVHQIVDTILNYDSTYYSNFNPEPYYDPTPIFEFSVSGADVTVEASLPASFYNTLICNDPDDEYNPYYYDSVFIDTFKGFYFKLKNPELLSAEQGAIRQLSLSSSYMTMYYHNLQNGDTDPDTTTHSFYFYNSYVYGGNNFSVFEHDYSSTDISKGGVDPSEINSGIETSRCLIQGMGGIGNQIEFDTAHIAKIKAEAVELGYSRVAVHSAKIEWGLESRTLGSELTLTDISRAAARLGIYYDIDAGEFSNDYRPDYELLGTGYVSDIDGYLNRSRMIYEQILTSAFQEMFNKPDSESFEDNEDYRYIVQLFPSWNEILYYNETVVGGSASEDNAPKIVLVYTFVK